MTRARGGVWVVGAVVGVATFGVLASIFTPAPHTGGDNATYLALGHSLATGTGYTELWDPTSPRHTKYPPVFPLLLGALSAAGASSWAAFKIFVTLSLGSAVLLVFAFVDARRGATSGAAVAMLTLLSAGWLDAGRWILSEPLFLVWTFLALWAADRGVGRLPPLGGGRAVGEAVKAGEPPSSSLWIAVAAAAAILAFFTRSAGLPLVLALLVTLAGRRHLRAAAAVGGAVAVLSAVWLIRARGSTAEGAYGSEFWLVNPYQPALGTMGWLDLPVRAWTNLRLYTGEILGGQWWGLGGDRAILLLGIALVTVAAWGWTLRVRLGAQVAEVFAPLYLGLILVWPEVWTGSRFLLPLTPLVLLYAGEALRYAGLALGRAGPAGLVAAGSLAVAVPSLPAWLQMADEGARCRRVAEGGDVFRCHPDAVQEFRDAAAWSSLNLPEGAIVLNRKPSTFYLLGGTRGRIFPFTENPDAFLEEADRVGAEYVLFDGLDGISLYYVPSVISARPLAFCHVRGWGGGSGVPGTELFGILPSDERSAEVGVTAVPACPDRFRGSPPRQPPLEGARIPLLARM